MNPFCCRGLCLFVPTVFDTSFSSDIGLGLGQVLGLWLRLGLG